MEGEDQSKKVKVEPHLVDPDSAHPQTNENITFNVTTGPSNIPSDLGPFETVFQLPGGGIIGGNSMVSELPQPQAYTTYLNMSQFNYTDPLSNDGSVEGMLVDYQKRVEELTSSLNQAQGMLAMAQAMNGSMQNTVNGLRSENDSLKSHYSQSCASYNSIFGDLTRARELETNLSKKVSVLEREKAVFRRDLEWVMGRGIPRMLSSVFRSEQFDLEFSKVQKVLTERGRELGRQEARDLLMANQRLPAVDPYLPRKVKDVVRGFKKTKWESMETIISSPDLSPNLLRSVLERGDSMAGEGSSSQPAV